MILVVVQKIGFNRSEPGVVANNHRVATIGVGGYWMQDVEGVDYSIESYEDKYWRCCQESAQAEFFY